MYKTPPYPSKSSYEGQVTFATKTNMADKMKIHELHHVKLCKYCSSVGDVINNASLRVVAWRKNYTDWPTDLAICLSATTIFLKPMKRGARTVVEQQIFMDLK